MRRIALVGLLKIELPERTIRFSDGGAIVFNGETYRPKDAVFGTVAQVEELTEGAGDSVASNGITLLPPDTSAPADLSRPGHQRARVRFWLQEYDVDAGVVTTNSKPQFDGQIDQTHFMVSKTQRQLSITIVSLAEQLFEGDIGNSLSPNFHKSVHPGELGHDNATGLVIPVAWGTERPNTGGSTRGGGGGYGNNLRDPIRKYAAL